MRDGRASRFVLAGLLAIGIAGAVGCDRVREAIDDIRRSTERNWEKGRRRLGGGTGVVSRPDAVARHD